MLAHVPALHTCSRSGGAFATWRREGVLERGQARESLERSVCWPSSWVAREVPEARLLSLEYAAPASGWEVGGAASCTGAGLGGAVAAGGKHGRAS